MSEALRRIEGLVGEVEALPGPAREKARALVRAVLDAHQEALARLLGALGSDAARAATQADEALGAVLLLHGLHPLDLPARVEQALERARPALRAHGGDVELIELAPDALRLRLLGTCHGCPSSGATLEGVLADALLALAPDAPPLALARGELRDEPSVLRCGTPLPTVLPADARP